LDFWQTFRLFLMPFCVSSFSALVKGKGFILIFSPKPMEIAIAAGACAVLCGVVLLLRRNKANDTIPGGASVPASRQTEDDTPTTARGDARPTIQ
jgi:hypothetical protein